MNIDKVFEPGRADEISLMRLAVSASCLSVSSDLLRVKQTAEIVGQYLGLIPILRTELRERNLGKCCGKSVQLMSDMSYVN